MDREDKRGIFFGVVGVLTLIVAIIGASFAYFSINAKSADDAVKVQAGSVQIVYEEGTNVAINEIIPSTKEIALRALNRAKENPDTYTECIDDNGYRVCGLYSFSLTNNSSTPVNATAKITPTALGESEKGFTNLKFVLNEVDETGAVVGTDLYEGTMGYTEFGLLNGDATTTMEIPANTTKRYRLFIWLNEAGEANDVEQGAIFKGTVKVDIPGNASGNITGTVSE